MRQASISLILILLLFAPTLAQDTTPWVLGLEELHRIDLLPEMRRSVRVGSVSSYDRTGGNDDGFSGKYSFMAKEDDGLVIADTEGSRNHLPDVDANTFDDLMEFYFDGEDSPRIAVKFREIFAGQHRPFVSPLVGYGAGGFYSYVPLPYEKSARSKSEASECSSTRSTSRNTRKMLRSIAGIQVRRTRTRNTKRKPPPCLPHRGPTSARQTVAQDTACEIHEANVSVDPGRQQRCLK